MEGNDIINEGKMSIQNYLINQSIKLEGIIGKIMLKIINNAHKTIFKLGISNINILENCKFLDIGFGGGIALKTLSQKFNDIELFGIDFSDEVLKAAEKNNSKDIESGKIKLYKADIEKMPFSNNFFDVITAFQTHYHWQNFENKIKEIYRILNENGQFIIIVEKYKINYHMKKFNTEDEIKKYLLI